MQGPAPESVPGLPSPAWASLQRVCHVEDLAAMVCKMHTTDTLPSLQSWSTSTRRGAPTASAWSPPGRRSPRKCTRATPSPTGACALPRCVLHLELRRGVVLAGPVPDPAYMGLHPAPVRQPSAKVPCCWHASTVTEFHALRRWTASRRWTCVEGTRSAASPPCAFSARHAVSPAVYRVSLCRLCLHSSPARAELPGSASCPALRGRPGLPSGDTPQLDLAAVQGHDEVTQYGQRDHEAYKGDRTKEALLTFADSLAPSAGQPHHFVKRAPPTELLQRPAACVQPDCAASLMPGHLCMRTRIICTSAPDPHPVLADRLQASRGVTRVAKTPGCALSGFALVKKVRQRLPCIAPALCPACGYAEETPASMALAPALQPGGELLREPGC